MENLPTDYAGGLDFNIKKTSKGGYADYNSSTWARKESALTDAEQAAIAEKLYRTFLEHQESDIQRLHNMIEVFQSQHCLSRQLAVYFNDHSMQQDCGHCSVCMGRWQAWPQPAVHDQQYDPLQVASYLSPFEQAYQAIRKAIRQRRFRSGDRLIENELAEMLGFSRTPVREALARLQVEGLAAENGQRGFMIVEFEEWHLNKFGYSSSDLFESTELESHLLPLPPLPSDNVMMIQIIIITERATQYH